MYREPDREPVRAEMMEILREHIPFLNRTELLPVSEADGRAAAEQVCASYALPNRAASAFDGIAVRFSDIAAHKEAGAGIALSGKMEEAPASTARAAAVGSRIETDKAGQQAAGVERTEETAQSACRSGCVFREHETFVYSNTGVAIPDGYDTVIAIEDVERRSAGEVFVAEEALPKARGAYVQPEGSQIKQGEVLLEEGEAITPEQIGLLVSAGIRSVNVYARPRVAVIPTGDELLPSGGPVLPGKNVESNSLMLCAMLRRFGAAPAALGIVPDEIEALRAAIEKAVRSADLVVIGAGSSKGSKDFTMDVLRQMGSVIVQEIGVAPGKHLSLSLIGGTPVIGVPGPPGGALLIGRYYLRAAVSLLQRGKIDPVFSVKAQLSQAIAPRPIDFMQPVRLKEENGRLLAAPVNAAGQTRAASRRKGEAVLYCPKGAAFQEGMCVSIELPDVLYTLP